MGAGERQPQQGNGKVGEVGGVIGGKFKTRRRGFAAHVLPQGEEVEKQGGEEGIQRGSGRFDHKDGDEGDKSPIFEDKHDG